MIQEDKLKEAQRLYETANADQRYVLERLFPELKESEDERTRQEIVRFIRMEVEDEIVGNKWLAWLEKQGEQKPYERKDFISIPFGAFDSELINETITIPDGCVATIEGKRIHIKKKDNSAIEAIKLNHTVDNNEMVESNFKVGDWVVRTNGDSFCNGSKFAQIQSIELDGEMCYLDTGRWLYPSEIRPWTINDAQDGDVLSYKDEISLYKHDIKNCTKEETTFGGFTYYGCYDGKRFITSCLYSLTEQDKMDIHPATKEQRNLFFQKMKEAGYEWDSKKKEPIRI